MRRCWAWIRSGWAWVCRGLPWLYQNQEFVAWLPGLVVLAVLGFVVFGALTPLAGDVLAWLAELPVLCAHAAAALGAAWVMKALYMYDLDADQETTLHAAARDGDAGARWVIVKDRLETLTCIALAFAFFWPSR